MLQSYLFHQLQLCILYAKSYCVCCFIKNVGINYDDNNDSTLAREEFNTHANILSTLNQLIMQVAIICN
jgi:hypothetical protein